MMFKSNDLKRVIIFSGKINKVKDINRELRKMRINSGEMHSDLSQAERDEMMFRFKSGQIDVLVATDILSRGIDIDDISMVINYDVPHDAEDYVHRIGRTARAERDGRAITFVSDLDIRYFKLIERFLGREIDKNPMPDEFGETPDYNSQAILDKKGRKRYHGKRKYSKGKPQMGKKHKKNPSKTS